MRYSALPHQVIMESWLAERDKAALWCAPGLGKTAAVLRHIDGLISSGASRGVLIISPLRVSRLTWPIQIAKWDHASWLRWVNLNTPEGMEAWENGSADIYLTHYDTLSTRHVNTSKGVRTDVGVLERCFAKRKSVPVDTLVIDESDALKSHQSKRGKDIRAVSHFFPRRVLMTGTPAPNSYEDLQPQMRILDDGERLGRSFHLFKQTWFDKKDWNGYEWDLKKGAKEKIDAKLSDICLTLSAEDWLDVPPCTTRDIEIALPKSAMREYSKMEKELLADVDDGEVVAVNAAVKAGKLLQMCSGSVYDDGRNVRQLHDEKVKALKKLIGSINGEPLLVFTQYEHEMANMLTHIEGSVRFSEKAIPDWMAGKIPVFVCNPRSMSHGLDGLQEGGRHACWVTLPWSFGVYTQANARLVRQGQERETVIHRIIAKDTIDEAVIEVLREKEDGQKGLMAALKNLRLLRK